MCGIAGIVSFDPREQPDPARLTRMRDVLAHRGPDEAGLVIDGPAGLAHRRLAIIDVASGQQPMANEDGSVWIAFNGEIYNHAAIRPGLEASGHVYRTRSDTETILHLYEEEGERVVDRLHGMFAFAIWDRRRQRLLLARDRLGIKPLYFATTETALLFGSEIKAILAAGFAPSFNEAAVPEYLAMRFLAGEHTFFKGVRRLLPGHVLTWSPGDSVQRRRYWHVPAPGSQREADAADPERLRDELAGAVARHLMSDVPLGVFLSGGLDSSALAALVARLRPEPIRTFAVGFADREANELSYARLAAAAVGADHREVVVAPDQFFEILPRLIWHEDEPIAFASSVPLFFVAQLASQHVKVVLTGEGADELFLGYNRYRVTHWNARLGQTYAAAVPRALRTAIREGLESLPRGIARRARRTFLGREPNLRDLYLDNFAVIPDHLRSRLLIDAGLAALDPYHHTLADDDKSLPDMRDRTSRLDLQTYLHELLMKQDQMSMAASIESRVPFLDDRLVAHVATLPGAARLPAWQTKVLLRRAVRDLVPPAILTRRKMGFPVPLDRWFRGSSAPLVDEFVLGGRAAARRLFRPDMLRQMAEEQRRGLVKHGDRLWLLINLEIWRRIFCDGEDPAAVTATIQRGRARTAYAHAVGQDGRPVAANNRWTGAKPADRVGALPAP